jgi:phage terminase large subunit
MIFRGLRTFKSGTGTAGTIKSLEGFTRAFVEEAQTVSQRSLDLLIPTIRAPGSEIWAGWNPAKPSDPIDKFFADNANDPDFVHVKVNYTDNPWFPEELRRDMERDRLRDPEKYQHIWLGGYLRNSEASVFRNWKAESFETPEDAIFYHGADWGFSIDPTVLVRAFIRDRTLFVDHEAYKVGCEIDRTPALFDSLDPAAPGSARKWPIRADSARPETISYMRRNGYDKISAATKGPNSVMDGIEFLKSYDIVVHPRCKHTIDELTLYSFKTDPLTGEVLPVLEDKKNHVIDALRYAVEGIRRTAPTAYSVSFHRTG